MLLRKSAPGVCEGASSMSVPPRWRCGDRCAAPSWAPGGPGCEGYGTNGQQLRPASFPWSRVGIRLLLLSRRTWEGVTASGRMATIAGLSVGDLQDEHGLRDSCGPGTRWPVGTALAQ